MSIKNFVIAGLLLLSNASFSQAKKAVVSTPVKNNPHIKVFEQAVISGDVNTAIMSINYYISEQGTNTPYADTLAMLYMQQGSYTQCYYWADKRLKQNPDNNNLLEMRGVCLDKLQQPKEAIDVFEKLFKKTGNPYHGYKLMELQYGIKRLSECLATAEATEKLTFKPEFIMTYNVGEQMGRTYLQAGVFNIHALALYDLDKKADAKSYFEKALALDSTFLLAKQNLEAVKSIMGGGTKNVQGSDNSPVASPANKQN